MPRQEIVLSYLIHPGEGGHKREVSGGAVPLSFSLYSSRHGNRFSYIPLASYESYIERTIFLAERGLLANARLEGPMEYALRTMQEISLVHETISAEQRRISEGLIKKVQEAESDSSQEATVTEVVDADAHKDNKAELNEMIVSENDRVNFGELQVLEDMERTNKDQDVAEIVEVIGGEVDRAREFHWHTISSSDRKNEMEQAMTLTQFLITERDSPLQSATFLAKLIRAERTLPFAGDALLFRKHSLGERVYDKSARIFDILQTGFRKLQEGNLVSSFIRALKDGRTGRIPSRLVEGSRISDEGTIYRPLIHSLRDGRTSTITRHTFDGLLKIRQAARVDRHVTFSDKEGHNSLLSNPRILAVSGTEEAVIQKSFVMANRYGIMAVVIRILDTFFAQDAGGREVLLMDETINASDKMPIDSDFPPALLDAIIENKSALVHEIIAAAQAKRELDAELVEALLLALTNPSEGLIEELLRADNLKLEKDSLMEYIRGLERLQDHESLVGNLIEGWNKDKPNRPASMMDDAQLGWWDVGFDDVMDLWKPAWDYLDPPSKDFDYSKFKKQVYDDNGVPFDPLGPTNAPQVEVKTPINHPIPEWSTVGKNEAWVDMFVFQEILIHIVGIFKRDRNKIAGMTGQQGLQYTLKEVHQILEDSTPWDDQYQRMFRFVRWNAEMISHKDSITILHREYKDWKDNIIISGGVFNHPHTLSQMEVQETGTIESISTTGFTEFEVENYIDGMITFSSSITSSNSASTSKLELYIDDILTHTFTIPDGVKRLSFEVPQGLHKYTFKYESEVGDLVRISGIVIAGVHFVDAHTEQQDAGEVRGLRAVDHLIQALIKYYQQHHKGKNKGAMKMKQRKIWLS